MPGTIGWHERSETMPRFVILEHNHPTLHWDLMLEDGDSLRTWRLAQAPASANRIIQATALPPHRLTYLDYEGPVSGNRGSVTRWDRGDYELLTAATVDVLLLALRGERIHGRACLTQISGDEWLFTVQVTAPAREAEASPGAPAARPPEDRAGS
jgi:hypothetical protein